MTTVPSDFADRIKVDDNGCWLWQLSRDSWGYGQTAVNRKRTSTHRLMYQRLVGPIPEGLQLDHLCRVRHCCNPAHLEAVTGRTNTLRSDAPTAINARKTHCDSGHPLSGENLYVQPTGERKCRTCRRRNWATYRRKSRAARAAIT